MSTEFTAKSPFTFWQYAPPTFWSAYDCSANASDALFGPSKAVAQNLAVSVLRRVSSYTSAPHCPQAHLNVPLTLAFEDSTACRLTVAIVVGSLGYEHVYLAVALCKATILVSLVALNFLASIPAGAAAGRLKAQAPDQSPVPYCMGPSQPEL